MRHELLLAWSLSRAVVEAINLAHSGPIAMREVIAKIGGRSASAKFDRQPEKPVVIGQLK